MSYFRIDWAKKKKKILQYLKKNYREFEVVLTQMFLVLTQNVCIVQYLSTCDPTKTHSVSFSVPCIFCQQGSVLPSNHL